MHYEIDSKRILIMGYSRGGNGIWYIAARNPKEFGAAVAMSAKPLKDALSHEWKIPLYVIHSREDEEFPIEEVTTTVRRMQEAGAPVTLAIVEEITHLETSKYVEPLRAAVPWLHKVWSR